MNISLSVILTITILVILLVVFLAVGLGVARMLVAAPQARIDGLEEEFGDRLNMIRTEVTQTSNQVGQLRGEVRGLRDGMERMERQFMLIFENALEGKHST